MAYYGSFDSLSFPKKGSEIVLKSKVKIAEIEKKIKEREVRVKTLAKEMKLGSSMDVLLNLDNLAPNHSSSSGDIQTGKAAALRTEIAAITKAREEQAKLQSIVRNLPAKGEFKLSFEELTYFGF
jgi:hypothetical protein